MLAVSGAAPTLAGTAHVTVTQTSDTSSVDAAAGAGLSVKVATPPTQDQISATIAPYFASTRLAAKLDPVMDALQSTMQQVLQQRPALASATFDFQSYHGTLKVVSDSLSAQDKAWLQQQLNGNAALVNAVGAFHQEAMTGYGQWAKLDGVDLDDADLAQVSAQADQRFGFMQLFQTAAAGMQRGLSGDEAYYRADGGTLDFSADPRSAAGFLSFYANAKAVETGATMMVTPLGTAWYGVPAGSVFGLGKPDRTLDFKPQVEASSAGVHLTA